MSDGKNNERNYAFPERRNISAEKDVKTEACIIRIHHVKSEFPAMSVYRINASRAYNNVTTHLEEGARGRERGRNKGNWNAIHRCTRYILLFNTICTDASDSSERKIKAFQVEAVEVACLASFVVFVSPQVSFMFESDGNLFWREKLNKFKFLVGFWVILKWKKVRKLWKISA